MATNRAKGYSSYTYDPFTLEGNFAFAAGVQEMLLQSQGGVIRVFPAIPTDWKDVSFRDLRAEGAFLISASKQNGQPGKIEVYAEKGGLLQLQLPAGNWAIEGRDEKATNGIWNLKTKKGERLVFHPA